MPKSLISNYNQQSFNMKSFQDQIKENKRSIKKLDKEEQKKIAGGNEYCYNMQGQYGICKTDALCDLDIPWCEPI